MSKVSRIPTPLRGWWRLFRMRVVPVAAWLAALALVWVLWQERAARVDAPGMFEARQANVASFERGLLVELTVGLFDEVRASQMVARLDDAAVSAALDVARAEKRQLEAQVRAIERELKQDAAVRDLDAYSRTRNYVIRTEQLRLEKLDRMIELESDEVELQRLAATLGRIRALRDGDVVGEQDFDEAKFAHEALKRKIAATKEALAVIEGRLREALAREELPASKEAAGSTEVALAPLREAVAVQVTRLAEIQVAREALVLASPLDGVVTALFRRQGETVMRGEPILTVTDPRSMHIVSFVEQGQPVEPAPGMRVEVRRRTHPVEVAEARVLKVSPQVEPLPQAIVANPAIVRWGVRVLISMPPGLRRGASAGAPARHPPRPGEVLSVRYFLPRKDGRGTGGWRLPWPAP